METIRVNMTPCEDIKTIHASQNDNEGREWGFELHNNGEKIDSSSISDQLVFKAYEGGTEQILPENGSTPTTSPFLGDIRYPQGLLSDQEFTYRQSPTEEDGLAKITDVKGNTIVWNQLVQNGNFADGTNGWTRLYVGTISASNNILTYSYTDSTEISDWQTEVKTPPINLPANHKVIISYDVKPNGAVGSNQQVANTGSGIVLFEVSPSTIPNGTWTHCTYYGFFNVDIVHFQFRMAGTNITNGFTANLKNVQVFDLTQMFGSGNEPSTVEEFTSLFSLPYYAYNQGTLLSFMGNGIKTVGANNMFDVNIRLNTNWVYQTASNRAILEFDVEPSTQYTIKIDYSSNVNKAAVVYKERYANRQISNMAIGSGVKEFTVTTPSNCRVLCIQFESNTSVIFADSDFPNRNSWYCLKDQSQISTLSLPISTYFPTGMKSAGSVYDELTENKATTRIGAVTFNGSENWYYDSNNALFQCAVANAVITNATTQYNVYTKNNRFEDKSWATRTSVDGSLGMYYGASYIFIKSTQFADVNAIKTWLQSNPVTVYYELATPIETSFTTASLVTENAEIPLSNNDGVLVGKCTEQLSSESGFIDAKIKLSDEDGECYSNKIQLHIERSPQ